MADASITLDHFGGNQALAMISGKATRYSQGTVAIRFKGSRKYNYVTIDIAADDTYSMTFGKYSPSKYTLTTIKEETGIYCEQLQQVFESVTGLYLSI